MPSPRLPAHRALSALAACVLLGGCGASIRTTTTTTSAAPAGPAAGGSGVGGGQAVQGRADAGQAGRLLLVLDASGSMAARDDAGRTRMEGAQEALRSVVADLPSDALVGLRVYGSRVKVRGRAAPGSPACTDSRLVVPVGPLDRRALTTAIGGFRPHGDTPIGYTLDQVAGDLGGSGTRAVVLVSDGEESCSADPCAAAKALAAKGIGLQVHTVGLEVRRAAQQQLQCVADATGGTYHDATSQDLTRTISDVVTRARQAGAGWSVRGLGAPGGGEVNPGWIGGGVLLLLLLWLLGRRRPERRRR
ncbi:VWA domain-containing protein [Arsenicicoccus sp. oral taxon 190]|uniref:VWA domain-containing protein n=1 Tax=Arsenicicoccus sp. oral taxon 190 TaxID=1658671 RepID=UPI00067AFBBE|nr:VWA domain-containing protein [Arsenicicoccus sp. oral taxon 190]